MFVCLSVCLFVCVSVCPYVATYAQPHPEETLQDDPGTLKMDIGRKQISKFPGVGYYVILGA